MAVITDDDFQELPRHEPAWAALDRVTLYRKQLLASGYWVVPANGKRPQLDDWVNIRATNAIIETWAITRADHLNTGVLCRETPFIDIDVTVEEVAEEIELLLESEIESSAVRIGLPPKRAIPFRTDKPFKKIATQFKAPNGLVHKVEVLGDGQMIVVDGIHPDTRQPYRWHGGEPGPKLRREDLPLITAESAAAFIARAAEVMRSHGWEEIGAKKSNGAGGAAGNTGAKKASTRERAYAQAALEGCAEELAGTPAGDRNNVLCRKCFRVGTMVGAGWIARAEVEATLFDAAACCKLTDDDGERQVRRTIQSGLDAGIRQPHPDLPDQDVIEETEPAAEPPPQRNLAEVHAVFKKWLGTDYDTDTIDAALAATASERLTGDPLWLLVISGPGNAKTETVQALSGAGARITSTIASEGALLSASPRKARAKTATGGLLRKIGDRGVLVIKDFTTILSADRNTRASVLAAVREVYDGKWERNVGSDGGQTLTWTGRIVVVAASTTAWDAAHAVVAAMGDRFVVIRADSNLGRARSGVRAIRNTGDEIAMREELAAVVGGVIGHACLDEYQFSDAEVNQLVAAADIVTMARTGVERGYNGDIVDAHAPEMPTRFAKQLAQMIRGAVAIGMTPRAGMRLAIRCARDSIPPLRRDILLDVAAYPSSRSEDVRKRIGRPRMTIRREMEALHMLRLLQCDEEEVTFGEKIRSIWRYSLAPNFDRATLLAMTGSASCLL
jgi:hypothetical protein